jgi:mRNA-degrading endonuclease toxin of MazEF toxin-antitoxin module
MKVKRGDVVLLSMPFAQGGGSKIRPAVVVQNDRNNARLGNTIVAAITRNRTGFYEETRSAGAGKRDQRKLLSWPPGLLIDKTFQTLSRKT